MSFLDSIQSLFGGKADVKVSELIEQIIGAVKPLISEGEGKVSETLAGAVADYGDLGDQLKGILGKITTATGDAKTQLTNDKNNIVSQIVAKGGAIIEEVLKSDAVPAGIKELAQKAQALLAKLK